MSERSSATALSITAFATLLLIALLMGANHVAARVAFDHGVDVATAVTVRSVVTALVVGALIVVQHVPVALTPRQRRFLPAIGVHRRRAERVPLFGGRAPAGRARPARLQHLSALDRALGARLSIAHRPERRVVVAMPVMLVGLALALDVLGAASGLGAALQWQRIGAGVAFALAAGGDLRRRAGADAARGRHARRPGANDQHDGDRRRARARRRRLAGRLPLAERERAAGGAWRS